MKILSIDTSTKNFSLAVAHDERIVRYRNLVLDKVLESSIIPAIEKILRDAKMTLGDLDGFAVGLGPGSFTSLRVGLSTIKAFALATGKPVVGVPTLDVIAMNVLGEQADDICVMCDARRQKIYTCLYKVDPSDARKPVGKTDHLLTTIDDLLNLVQGKTVFVGDAVGLWRPIIEEHYRKKGNAEGHQAVFSSEKNAIAQAAKLSYLAYGRFKKKEYDDVERLVPLYLYAQDCQVEPSKKS